MKLLQASLLQIIIIYCLTGCSGLIVAVDDKRSLGELADDATITSSINVKYLTDELVSALDINVDTYRGVVTLDGLVDNQTAATRAIDLALSAGNVAKVISNLTIRDQALSPRGLEYQ
ncbi:MAG: BON domain-containing protein [Proteobacteria bacterium]|nr:BON domain-containing protein [Pseudomonadota bacterium]